MFEYSVDSGKGVYCTSIRAIVPSAGEDGSVRAGKGGNGSIEEMGFVLLPLEPTAKADLPKKGKRKRA